MLLLAGICWFCGLTEPYILSGFTDRFFTERATGAEMMVFFTCSVLGTWLSAGLLDSYASRGCQDRGAIVTIAVFFVVHVLSFCCAGAVEFSTGCVPSGGWSFSDTGIALPTMGFALWGFSDAMMNTYVSWLVGCMYPEGTEKARAIGFSKMINSGAHVYGYAVLPTHRVSGRMQFLLNVAFFAIAVITVVFVKPQAQRQHKIRLA